MKRLFIAAAAACLAFASPVMAEETGDELLARVKAEMKAFCATKWGTDFSMMEYCFDQQWTAAGEMNAVVELVQNHEDITLTMVLAQCIEKWEVPTGGHDYPMVQYCWNQQYKAYQKMSNK